MGTQKEEKTYTSPYKWSNRSSFNHEFIPWLGSSSGIWGSRSSSSSSSSTHLRLWPLPLLVIANSSSLCLKITNISQVNPHGTSTERVILRPATVLLVGGTKASDEGVEAAPCLAKRAGAWSRWVREPKERARWVVHFGLTELVKVVKELQHMSPTAQCQRKWWTMVPQVLAESVPVSPLLVLVAAWCVGWRWRWCWCWWWWWCCGWSGGGGGGGGGCWGYQALNLEASVCWLGNQIHSEHSKIWSLFKPLLVCIWLDLEDGEVNLCWWILMMVCACRSRTITLIT